MSASMENDINVVDALGISLLVCSLKSIEVDQLFFKVSTV